MVELLPIQDVQTLINLSDTLYSEATSLVTRKKAALIKGTTSGDEEIGAGHDILSVLRECGIFIFLKWLDSSFSVVKANMEASEEDRLPEEEVIGQVK